MKVRKKMAMKKQPNKKPLPLKIKLLLVLIPLVFVYTWVITAVNASYIMRGTQETLEKTLGQTVKITSEHIAESIANNKKLTVLLASRVGSVYGEQISMPYNELDAGAFADEISALGVSYGFLHMMVADSSGFTRTKLHTNLVEKKADYYTAIMNDGQPSYVSDVSIDQGTFQGTYVLNYSAPIKNEAGRIIGVLICKSDAAALSELVSGISVGEAGSTFIMDNNGQCIAHQDAEMLFGGIKYQEYKNNANYPELNSLWNAMVSQDSGYMTYAYQGARLAAFSRIEGTNNWSIAVTVSEGEFMRTATEARSTVTWIAAAMILLFSCVLILLFRFSTKSIQQVASRLENLADGDLNGAVLIDRSSEETYRLSQAAAKLVGVTQSMIHETERLLGEIANGNLTVTTNVPYPGDYAELKSAIESNLIKLNDIIQRISRTSEEVARGSSQMASGASGLAQGASEQASSLEELFETVTTLAQHTYEIGGMDKTRMMAIDAEDEEGADADEVATRKIEAADTLAEKLTVAISRIAEASDDIRRIASDIEAISSETGMLALNASVEATHAGDAGRGFSVIASEIRSLSDKSRDAAKDADRKIGSISRAVNRGKQTVELTVSNIGEMTLAMNQVKSALEQISNIVENIAATAEETAAGSEELSAQADLLKGLVAEFKIHGDDITYHPTER